MPDSGVQKAGLWYGRGSPELRRMPNMHLANFSILSLAKDRFCCPAVLCRDEAVKIWRLKDKMNEMGISVVGMVHQCDMAEVC